VLRFVLALALSWPASAVAQAIDPLLAVHDADPLRLAQAVDRLGDDGVLDRLAEAHPHAVRRLAVSGCRFLYAPERALPVLASLAAGRDPDLAPAAMRTILAIARGLDRAGLDAREHDGDELPRTREILTALAEDDTARPDLRRAAETALALLAPLGD
jgi:hypothetical protein